MELLIRIVDSYPGLTGDDAFDSKVSRRGDVIVAVPNGWAWGDKELTEPFWRILKLPNVSEAMAQSLVGEEAPLSEAPDPTLQFRGFTFDVDKATGQLRNYLRDDTRASPSFTSQIDDAFITNNLYKVQKARWAIQKLKYA